LVNAPWTSYLVSARTVEVPLFSDKETRLLLTEPLRYSSLWHDDDPGRPRPRFESSFWGEDGIERIHAEAGGWPHLVQLIAETIVDLLNGESEQQVTSPLMERALDRAMVSGHNVLYELLRRESSVPGEWEYLSTFLGRESQPPPDDKAIAQSLHRRLLVEEEAGQWRLRVPLMARWLRKGRGYAEIERLISSDPSQQVLALSDQVRLLAQQAGETANLAILDEILAPLPEGEKGFLAQTGKLRGAVHEIVTLQSRLDTIDRPVLRKPLAELLCKEIENFRHRIVGFDEPLATEFRTAADQWLKIAGKQLREAQAVVEKELAPQVFRAGDPVDREQEAFVPRDSVVGKLERQVLLSTGCPGVVLYGRRRVGKSTVLRNLSGFLPSTVHIVNISMQKPDASTSLELLVEHLVREVSTVFDERLPSRTPKDLKDLFGFLSECNQILKRDDRRLVISVDEYENIDQKIGEGVFPKDLLAMFRESIQSHRRITWIFAGSHKITELVNAPWTSYLVSARTVEVPLFSDKETRLLLTEPLKYSSLWRDDDPGRPRPRFESGFWRKGGIERIHAEAGGWPHLVQLIAETIVDLLNDESERQVTLPLIERALDQAVVSGYNVLYELLYRESTLPGEWEYLSTFLGRESQPLPDDKAIVRSLRRRLLVEEKAGQWRLRVPLMARWLRKWGEP
jgi:AAA domain